MTYATRAHLESLYGMDTIAGRESMLGAEGIARALSAADAEIDSALATRYAVPLVTVPPLIESCACELAYLRLWAGQDHPAAQRAADAARRLLDQIGSGSRSLGLPAITAPAATGGPGFSAPDAVFCSTDGF